MANDPLRNDLSKLWQNQKTEDVQMSIDAMRVQTHKFQRRILWRNVREYAGAALLVALFGFHFFNSDGVLLRTGSALVILGTLYVVYQIHRRGSSQPVPAETGIRPWLDFHRTELMRQRDAMQSVWRWYILPFVPGFAVITLSRAIENPAVNWVRLGATVAGCAIVFVLIFQLNQRAARKLQRQIDELEDLEKES